MTSSCAAASAALTASKHALDVQAANQHVAAVAADKSAAVKHGVAIATHATVSMGTSSSVQNSLLSLRPGGA
jgi:hypothetical protein